MLFFNALSIATRWSLSVSTLFFNALSIATRWSLSVLIASPLALIALLLASIAFLLALILSALVLISSAFLAAAACAAFAVVCAASAASFAAVASSLTLTKSFCSAKAASAPNFFSVFISWPSPKPVPSKPSPECTLTPLPISAACASFATKPIPPNTRPSTTAFANIFFIENPSFLINFNKYCKISQGI